MMVVGFHRLSLLLKRKQHLEAMLLISQKKSVQERVRKKFLREELVRFREGWIVNLLIISPNNLFKRLRQVKVILAAMISHFVISRLIATLQETLASINLSWTLWKAAL